MTTSSDTELIRRLEHALTLLECATSGGPPDLIPRPSTLLTEARARLAHPEPEGVTDEQWDAIRERLWDNYETVGYQGERFMYQGDFDTALDVARKDLARFARPTIKPVPVAERPWEREGWCDAEGRCWWWIVDQPGELPHWIYCQLEVLSWTNFTASLPHHALPVPQQPS